MTGIGIYIAAIIFCILLSAFFSASEMSFSSNNKVRLEHGAEEGEAKSRLALFVTEHFEDALSAILVGNNLVNIAASSLGSVAVILAFGEKYAWASTAIITAAVIIFGETIPKIAAQRSATAFSLAFAGPVRVLMVVLKPVTWVVVQLVSLLTAGLKGEETDDGEAAVEELHTIIDTAENEDVIDEDASELVSAAIDFAEISASEVMTARVDVMALDIDDSWAEIMETLETAPHSRIPVYEDSIDNIIGVLSMNHFLKALIDQERVDIRSLLMKPCFVYKTMKLPSVLSELRNAKQHLAIVTDEYGGTLGVVTMEDVLEEIVGDIWDDTDIIEPEIIERGAGIYEMDGDTPVSELLELMNWPEWEFDFDSETIGGWCIEMLEGFPKEGSSFVYKNAEVTVTEVDERRVRSVRITCHELPQKESE